MAQRAMPLASCGIHLNDAFQEERVSDFDPPTAGWRYRIGTLFPIGSLNAEWTSVATSSALISDVMCNYQPTPR